MIAAGKFLEKLNIPGEPQRVCPDSPLRFADESQFGFELSSMNNLRILQQAIAFAKKGGVTVNRVDECRGIFRLPDQEIRDMVDLCGENGISLVLSTGPRAIYDTGGFIRSKNGVRSGYRLRGVDNLRYAVEDIFRATALGCRGFLIYDEGMLNILNSLRVDGELPKDVVFKLSVHCGCSNPASAQVYEQLGADSINVIPDLDLAMLSDFRRSVKCILDVFTDTAADAGGFVQTHLAPEIIRTCAPVYFKVGAVAQNHQNHLPSDVEVEERVKQLVCVHETIRRKVPNAIQLGSGSA